MRKEVIGNQTLYLGDCRDIMPTMGKVDAVVTDPPYGMSFKSNYRKEAHRIIESDDSEELLIWACNLATIHSKYVFMRWDNLASIPKPKSVITWVKNNLSMGDLEHEHGRQTEVAAFYPGVNHSWPNGRPSDVVNYVRTGNNYHPTEKPIDLMKKVLGWTMGHVADPFMGSGTTLVACQQMGRHGIGIEIDPKYFQIACERVHNAWLQPDLFIGAAKED